MLRVIGCGLLCALATGAAVGAAKPDSTPNWRCRVSFRDADADKVVSDDAGPYTDGAGGVTCYIVNEPGAVQDRWLFMTITGTQRQPPTRVVRYVGQTFEGVSYPLFDNHGTFEVIGLAKAEWNPDGPSPQVVRPFRAYLRHPGLPFVDGLGTFVGDSNLDGPLGSNGTSSVFVRPVDACSWTVTAFSVEEPLPVAGERDTRTDVRVMRLYEGGRFPAAPMAIGDFTMPFQATVAVIAHKTGCQTF